MAHCGWTWVEVGSETKIKNEIYCDAEYLTIDVLKSALYEIETRKKLFNNGTEIAKQFLINIIEQ